VLVTASTFTTATVCFVLWERMHAAVLTTNSAAASTISCSVAVSSSSQLCSVMAIATEQHWLSMPRSLTHAETCQVSAWPVSTSRAGDTAPATARALQEVKLETD
jgi:hypothetical protein